MHPQRRRALLPATGLLFFTFLGALPRHAAAQEACPAEGEACFVEGIAATCTLTEAEQLLCLADPVRACSPLADGDPCPTFAAEGGVCRLLEGALICVPNDVAPACEGIAVGEDCDAEGNAGRCYPAHGQLACGPGTCATEPLQTPCTAPTGRRGWCRLTPESEEPVCTTECIEEGDACDWSGMPGKCLQYDSGRLQCTSEDAPCLEGDSCTTAGGEEGTCVIRGGAGELGCLTDEQLDARPDGGCCGGLPSAEASSGARPVGMVGLGLAMVFARRRRTSRRRDVG
jgi:hypothetical protein